MLNVYFDDSGSSPSQRIVIASALIVPTSRLQLMESEWANFIAKFQIDGFHASECAAKNNRSPYAGWDDNKVKAAFNRVASITLKYGIAAVSFAIRKSDYDELMPEIWRDAGGHKHYTWACRHALRLIREWCEAKNVSLPVKYFFDWQTGKDKAEIETMMRNLEVCYPGKHEGHYSFEKRQGIPASQCTDLLAWCSLAKARFFFENTPISEHAERTFNQFHAKRNGEWLQGLTVSRSELANSLNRSVINDFPRLKEGNGEQSTQSTSDSP